jgi:hypothetical protein
VSCEQRDSMAALALGALSQDEAEDARRHAADCAECGAELARQQTTVRMLEAELPRVPPPPLHRPVREATRRRPARQPLLVAAVAALAAVVVAVGLFRDSGTGRQAVASMTPGNAGAATHGQARIVGPGRGPAFLQVDLQDVPPAPAGRHYEVWVLPRGTTAMAPLGAFRPRSRDVSLRLPLPGSGPFSAVDVSVQPDGGPETNSGVHLASGSFATE